MEWILLIVFSSQAHIANATTARFATQEECQSSAEFMKSQLDYKFQMHAQCKKVQKLTK